ncbi:MAG TPA: Pr6Pr family membrane protein [Cyclobacteriaceae bacterium]|nr:Pr6Pr family membrane protein [Cyclobacteriaceae bacterium]
MKQLLALVISISSLVAVVLQLDLMLSHSTQPLGETLIRFFSFFTILTNSLVAGYFSYLSYQWIKKKQNTENELARLTAVAVYIFIVGLVYQVLLRHIWDPTGLQKVVDELLHSVVPVLVILFWLISRNIGAVAYRQIGSWLIYPAVYLVYVLLRGYASGFYPYPFLDVSQLGFQQVIFNCLGMTLLFVLVSLLFVWLSKPSGAR